MQKNKSSSSLSSTKSTTTNVKQSILIKLSKYFNKSSKRNKPDQVSLNKLVNTSFTHLNRTNLKVLQKGYLNIFDSFEPKSYFFVLTQNTLTDNECYLECYKNELMNTFKFYVNLNDIDQIDSDESNKIMTLRNSTESLSLQANESLAMQTWLNKICTSCKFNLLNDNHPIDETNSDIKVSSMANVLVSNVKSEPRYLNLTEFESGKEEFPIVEASKEQSDVKQIAASIIFNSKNQTTLTSSLTKNNDQLKYIPLEMIASSAKHNDDFHTKTEETRYAILDTTKTQALHLTLNSFRQDIK